MKIEDAIREERARGGSSILGKDARGKHVVSILAFGGDGWEPITSEKHPTPASAEEKSHYHEYPGEVGSPVEECSAPDCAPANGCRYVRKDGSFCDSELARHRRGYADGTESDRYHRFYPAPQSPPATKDGQWDGEHEWFCEHGAFNDERLTCPSGCRRPPDIVPTFSNGSPVFPPLAPAKPGPEGLVNAAKAWQDWWRRTPGGEACEWALSNELNHYLQSIGQVKP